VRTVSKRRTAEGKVPTDFAMVSCPANMIVLQAVNMGDLRAMTKKMLTGLAEISLRQSTASPGVENH